MFFNANPNLVYGLILPGQPLGSQETVGKVVRLLERLTRKSAGQHVQGDRMVGKGSEIPPRNQSITQRDLAVVQLVATFKQLSSSHIAQLLFNNNYTPSNRSLVRLIETDYLSRIERRIVGGTKGGSGQYVYQLGRRGYYLHFTGRFEARRAISFHSLAIADTYVKLKELASIIGYTTEPDCWTMVGGVQLKPDLYVELSTRASERLRLWFEVDMATEQQGRIRAKLETYWRAYNDCDWPVFPRVIFVAIDNEREKQLKWILSNFNKEELFQVCTLDTLSALIQ